MEKPKKTWTDRYNEGLGITVGKLKVGDIFRIDNRVGTVLIIDGGRMRVSYRAVVKSREVIMHDDDGNPRTVTFNGGSADVANIALSTQVDEILGKEDIMDKAKKSKKNGNGKRTKAKVTKNSKNGNVVTRQYKGLDYRLSPVADGFKVTCTNGYDETFSSLTSAARGVRAKHGINSPISGPVFWKSV